MPSGRYGCVVIQQHVVVEGGLTRGYETIVSDMVSINEEGLRRFCTRIGGVRLNSKDIYGGSYVHRSNKFHAR